MIYAANLGILPFLLVRLIYKVVHEIARKPDESETLPMVVTTPPLLKTAPAAQTVETASGAILLAAEGSTEHWLDLGTGMIETRAPAVTAPGPLATAVRAELDAGEFTYYERDADVVVLFFRQEPAKHAVFVSVEETPRVLNVWTSFAALVPAEARPAVEALLDRINGIIKGGRMDLYPEGDVIMRIRAELHDAPLPPDFVRLAMRGVVAVADDYHDVIMRVAFGGMTVEQAIVEKELW